jgi:hypothetical protein
LKRKKIEWREVMKKPKKCCKMGEYKCTVPMPVKGRRVEVDFCIADIVASLNAGNITTISSCCGHGKLEPSILLEDGRRIWIVDNNKIMLYKRGKK